MKDERRGYRIRRDPERCTGCGGCMDYYPDLDEAADSERLLSRAEIDVVWHAVEWARCLCPADAFLLEWEGAPASRRPDGGEQQ